MTLPLNYDFVFL